MKEILTYHDYVREDAFADPTQNTMSRPEISQFFGGRTLDCPFCKLATAGVHETTKSEQPSWLGGGHYFAKELVSSCGNCGWWRVRKRIETTGDIEAESAVIKNAVLRKYELASKDVPISILQTYLRDHFDDVTHIHDAQMELLVKSVFSEHFSCDVEHVGKSHDGGIDLLLVQSDSPVVVQVKRRRSLSHVEGVSGIRELLGATLLKGGKKCIYVSTCSKFSEPSKDTAAQAIDLGLVESYELYDFSRFSAALKLTTTSNLEPWRKYLELETKNIA
jgi:restriction system protein